MRVYSNEFKEEAVKKHLIPGGKSVTVLSKEIGVSEQTIRNWIYKYKSGITDDSSEFNLIKISDSEKLKLLLDSKTKSENDIGIWLREKGLKSEHLKLWEEQMKEKMNNKQDALKEENKKLKEEVKKLQNELDGSVKSFMKI